MIKKAFVLWIMVMSLSLQAAAYEGVIKFYNHTKGLGFITPTQTGDLTLYRDLVFFESNLLNLTKDIDVLDLYGYCVRFDISNDPTSIDPDPDLDMTQTLYAINVYLVQDCKTSL